MTKPAPLTLPATKAAVAAGVKQVALITHVPAHGKTVGPSPVANKLVTKPVSISKASPARTPAKKVTTKKWAAKKKPVIKAPEKPKPQVVQAATQTKVPLPTKPASVANTSSKKPSPSIRSQEQ